jgi:group I intron endonuclease
MKVDYSKGKIYKITNDFNNDIYVGSTCDTLVKRFSNHKKDSKKERNEGHPFYKLMNELGHTRFRIQLIEDYPCEDTYQLRQREGHFIREMGTLNLVIAGRTRTEYNQDNKERINEKHKEYKKNNQDKIKQYNIEHKEDIKQYHKIYRENNIESLKEKSKEYRETNKEIIKQRKKEYYEKNKDKINEKLKLKYLEKKSSNSKDNVEILS